MGLIGTFTDTLKLGSLRIEAETKFAPGDSAALVPLSEVPAVREATAALLAARQREAEARQRYNTLSRTAKAENSDRVAALVAQTELGGAEDEWRKAMIEVAHTEAPLIEVRARERARIIGARTDGEKALRRELLAALEQAAEAARALFEYRNGTADLVGGWRHGENANGYDWVGEFVDELPTRESLFTVWRRRIHEEGLV